MNTITGRVTIKESGVGIPDLLVVVFDVDPNTQPEEVKPVPGPTPTPPPAPPIAQPAAFPQGDRLGSVLTDANGAFTITYADEEFRVRNSDEKRPDLLLMVFAPEEAGQDGNLRPLFVSPAIRQNAGRTEHYLIRLAAQKMEETALAIPTEATFRIGESRSVIHKINQAVTQQAKINEEVKRIAVE
jgi:hypothetical protein